LRSCCATAALRPAPRSSRTSAPLGRLRVIGECSLWEGAPKQRAPRGVAVCSGRGAAAAHAAGCVGKAPFAAPGDCSFISVLHPSVTRGAVRLQDGRRCKAGGARARAAMRPVTGAHDPLLKPTRPGPTMRASGDDQDRSQSEEVMVLEFTGHWIVACPAGTGRPRSEPSPCRSSAPGAGGLACRRSPSCSPAPDRSS